MSGMWLLRVRDEFSAAHALRHYQGKCENMHGHNFHVEVCVCGDRVDEKTGMLLDFRILKNALKTILNDFDHCFVNERHPFEEINPSSENMARVIWERFAEFLTSLPEAAERGVKAYSVTVSEKDAQDATYFGYGLKMEMA